MPYGYLEHISDVDIHAEGQSVNEALSCAAEAMLNVMFELTDIKETVDATFGVESTEIPLLFVEVLNEILSIQDRHSFAFKRLAVKEIKNKDSRWIFIGTVYGEPFNPDKHAVKTEVKGTTYSGLAYRAEDGRHIFECVVDV